MGNSIGAGKEAATCTIGWKTFDRRLDSPMARPAGTAQRVPIRLEASTRRRVTPPAWNRLPHSPRLILTRNWTRA